VSSQDMLFGDEMTPALGQGGMAAASSSPKRRRRPKATATSAPDSHVLESLRAFVAPVAGDAGAVAEDPRVIALARALMTAFAAREYAGVLTKAEVLEQVRRNEPDLDERLFESRFALFIELGLLHPYLNKKHQTRFSLNPAGLVGLLVLERLGARGGIDELLHLLGRTRVLLEDGQATGAEVRRAMATSCQLLHVFSGDLRRLIDTAPLHELIGEHTQQDPQHVTDAASALNKVVTARFAGDGDMSALAYDLLRSALEYRELVTRAVERVLDQGGGSLDFSVLSPEQYLAAAIDEDLDALSAVATGLVVDPPTPWIHPGEVIDILDELTPRRRSRQRPPAPTVHPEADPLGRMAESAARERRQLRTRAESRLQGANSIDVTSFLRDAGWPSAAQVLTEFLTLAHDPDEPFAIELAEGILIDPDAQVTYLHPTRLMRTDVPAPPDLVPADTAQSAEPANR
jgi:hypothetical protein